MRASCSASSACLTHSEEVALSGGSRGGKGDEALDIVGEAAQQQAKPPDEKVYRVTPDRRAAMVAELGAAAPHHEVRAEFLVLPCFAHLLSPARLAEVLDGTVRERRRRLIEDVTRAERELDGRLTPAGAAK